MVIKNFLEKRKSVRDFKEKNIEASIVVLINDVINSVNKEASAELDVKFTFCEEGNSVYEVLNGNAGYGGVMIKAPSYIAMDVRKNTDKAAVLSAYYFERLITELSNLELDTCWVTLKGLDASLMHRAFGEDSVNVSYALALGYGKSKKFFEPETYTDRLSISEIAFMNDLNVPAAIEDLDNLGLSDIFAGIRFAPTSYNSQAWRYVISSKEIKLYMVMNDTQKERLADAGIAMCYFEAMAKTMGINSKWELTEKIDYSSDICYIGKFNI